MTKYMIRKPEFMQGAERARFFPGTFMTLVIALAVFTAYFVVSLLAGVIYAAASIGRTSEGDMSSYMQGIEIFSLYFEAALIACTLIYVRYIEKRPLGTVGLGMRRFALKYSAGFGIGFILLAAYSSPLFINFPVYFTGIMPSIIVFLGAFIVQSATEEIMFRGYIMTSLLRRRGAALAVLISSAAFALLHLPGAEISVTDFLIIFLLGLMLALYVLRTNNLWGAMGLHAGWNFLTGLIAPIALGPMYLNYAIFDSPGIYEDDPVYFLIVFLLFSAVILLLLFAGKNRLVARRTEEQIKLAKALDITKKALAGDRAALNYAMRVSELAQGGGKIAALLYHSLSCGASPGYLRQEFGDDMLKAAESMTVRYGEGPKEYWERVAQHPAALSAKRAETMLDEIKRPKAALSPGVWFAGGRVQCPMLRWGIEEEHCRQMAQAVDGNADAEEYVKALDHDVCSRCPGRRFMGSIHRGQAEFLQRYGEDNE